MLKENWARHLLKVLRLYYTNCEFLVLRVAVSQKSNARDINTVCLKEARHIIETPAFVSAY
jgi:hypothetical protein